MSSDGAVPVHFKVDDGNVGDPATHIETWSMLRQIVGSSKFLYVADCKLCTSDNMRYIDGQHGSFITVPPKSRKELDKLKDKLQKPRCRIHTAKFLRKAVDEILRDTATAAWIEYGVERLFELTEIHDERKHPHAPLRVRRTK